MRGRRIHWKGKFHGAEEKVGAFIVGGDTAARLAGDLGAARDWLWPPKVARSVVLAVVLLALVLGGYIVPWTGFGESVVGVGSDEDLRRAKTLWDWMELAIVPVLLAFGAYFLNAEATRRAEMTDAENTRRARVEEVNTARETALREYMNQMGTFMVEHDVRRPSGENESARKFMEALTLSILQNFSVDRNAQNLPSSVLQVESEDSPPASGQTEMRTFPRPVLEYSGNFLDLRKEILQFLHRAGLIEARDPTVRLKGANLAGADLSFVDLEGASLRETDLSSAALVNANLKDADLRGANFSRATLAGADLSGASREGAVGLP